MTQEIRAVEIEAEVWQVKSMADMSWHVVLSVPEYMLPQVQWLMAHLHEEVRLVIERKDGRKNGK